MLSVLPAGRCNLQGYHEDRRLPDRLGSHRDGENGEQYVVSRDDTASHKFSGTQGSLPSSETFSAVSGGCHVLVKVVNSTVVAYINPQGGGAWDWSLQLGSEIFCGSALVSFQSGLTTSQVL